jgi:hypothetical protein
VSVLNKTRDYGIYYRSWIRVTCSLNLLNYMEVICQDRGPGAVILLSLEKKIIWKWKW